MVAANETLMRQVASYLPDDRVQVVRDALAFASEVHTGQSRRSGSPYIDHPVSIAQFLAELTLDATTLAAALLHDVVEDCGVTIAEVESRFGADVARLVDGVTKLTKFDTLAGGGSAERKPGAENARAESIRKMLVAMAEDIRVVLIKLADRLHNMKTLGALPPARRVAIAQETLDIYAPLAARLGIWNIKWQLEDLAFRHLQPNRYRAISRLLASKRQAREEYVQQVTEVLKRELTRAGLEAEVTGRPKNIYSIYQKTQTYAAQGKEFSDIYDLFAVRVLVSTLPDCYGALGVVHALWRPLPGQFDDYVANPNQNMYQSLHTTVRCIGGVPIEVQIRTQQMHQVAEYGVAAHWRYKDAAASKDVRFDEKMTWVRQLLEWQREVGGAEEFLESVKTDIFQDQVYVYTPKGDIKELPAGSTPIDFAYRIHTDLGHGCIGAKVNGKLMALDSQLRNGDTVEVLTSKIARGPSLDWLNLHLGYAKTANARQSIRAWFRRQEREANIQRGRELLKRELRRLSADVNEKQVARLFKLETVDELLAALGSGGISTAQVASRLSGQHAVQTAQEPAPLMPLMEPTSGVQVLGIGEMLTRMGQCCHPLPGDEIVGYVTRVRGVTVHRKDCPNLRVEADRDRLVPVAWGHSQSLYPVRLRIEAWDRVGLLRDISSTVSAEGVNIAAVVTQEQDDSTVLTHLTLHVKGMEQLNRLFSRLEDVRGVTSIVRETSTQVASKGKDRSVFKHGGAAARGPKSETVRG